LFDCRLKAVLVGFSDFFELGFLIFGQFQLRPRGPSFDRRLHLAHHGSSLIELSRIAGFERRESTGWKAAAGTTRRESGFENITVTKS